MGVKMAYRNLTLEQFAVIKQATKKVCEVNSLKTLRDFMFVGNFIIDEIKAGNLTFADLLQPIINCILPKPEEKEILKNN